MRWLLIMLILVPQIVNAECAWVLWSKFAEITIYEGEGERAWKVERALTGVGECQNLLKKIVDIKAKGYKGPYSEVKVVIGDTNGLIITSGTKDGKR